jgi:hypothetical protein
MGAFGGIEAVVYQFLIEISGHKDTKKPFLEAVTFFK